MSVREIQAAITQLPPGELADIFEWIAEFEAEVWDQKIARDAKAGRFDAVRQRVREQRKAGSCRPL